MRRRNGSMLIEMCLAMAMASVFFIGYRSVVRQLRHLELRTAEKQALTAAAIALGRAVVDRPELVIQPRELEVELRRLSGAARGEKIEVERRPSESLAADVITISVSRTHPITGRCEGKATVMLDAPVN